MSSTTFGLSSKTSVSQKTFEPREQSLAGIPSGAHLGEDLTEPPNLYYVITNDQSDERITGSGLG